MLKCRDRNSFLINNHRNGEIMFMMIKLMLYKIILYYDKTKISAERLQSVYCGVLKMKIKYIIKDKN